MFRVSYRKVESIAGKSELRNRFISIGTYDPKNPSFKFRLAIRWRRYRQYPRPRSCEQEVPLESPDAPQLFPSS